MEHPADLDDVRRHAQLSRDLVRALGNGDDHGANELIMGLSPQDCAGVLIQTVQIVLALQKNFPLTVNELCDRLDQGAP